ncbi:MAG: hypothetical protein Kow002_20600 [Anaerolineales bacterium]
MDTSPRTYRFIPVDIYTSGYRVVGKIMVANTGVIGVMNDSTNSTLEVHDARLAKVHMPTKLVDHFDLVRMVKRRVVAVCLSRVEDLGPKALTRGGYGSTVEYPVHITTQVYEVEGKLELAGRFDFQGLMYEGTREFLTAFDATLTAVLIPNVRVESPAILVNRRHADIVALLKQRAKEEK